MQKNQLKQNIIILKNDAVGDLTQSLKAISNIIKSHKDAKITIYLSERSKNFSFLIKEKNIKIVIIKYDLSLFQKIKFLKLFALKNISKVFILTPKNFYFMLPFIFRRIKFYALCINGPKNYYRPSIFLRKFLFKFVVNHREAIFKRSSTIDLQINLTKGKNTSSIDNKLEFNFNNSELLNKYLPKNYLYFHFKKNNFKKLGWNLNDMNLLFNEFLKYFDNIIFTKDIESKYKNNLIFDNYNILDFSNGNFIKKNNNIFLYENITGKNLYNVIKYSNKVVAFHGMMTNLAAIEKRPVIDLWYSKIKNWEDYRNNRNAFYEFKPNYKSYNFIIPRKDMNKTIIKMKYALKNNHYK
jgi:hypothetical protein